MNITKTQIPTQLKLAIDRHKIITFDVFDTLLIRRVSEPHDVFRLMEYNLNINNFTERRIQAEQEARKTSCTEEVTLFDIYNKDPILTKEIMRRELETEASVLCVNPPIKNIFDYCLLTNRRIFIISDMYLPKSFIESILKREGYNGWEDLFVSCEEGRTKGTGNLFRKIINDRKLPVDSVLHIGDNPWSDAFKPIECNIKSFLYQQPFKSQLNHDPRCKSQFQNDGSLATHLLLGLIASKFPSLYPAGRLIKNLKEYKANNQVDEESFYPNLKNDTDYWFKFGYSFAGPAVLGFTAWIAQRATVHKVDEVLFIGRDGYVLTKLFKKYYPEIPCQYIFAPRYVRAMCAAKAALISDTSRFTVTDLITLVDAFITRDWLPQTWQAPIIENDMDRRIFLRNKIYKINERIETVINEYKNYLTSLNLKNTNKHIAIVDSCSLNLSSQKLLTEFLPNSKIIGLYWVIPEGHNPSDIKDFKCETFQLEMRHQITNWNLMEWILTAPYPGVSYIENNNIVFNKPHPNETERNRLFPLMESGVLSFADDCQKTFRTISFLNNPNTLIKWINQFCTTPLPEDRLHFAHIKHAPDAASKQWEDCMQTWEIKNAKQTIKTNTKLWHKTIRGENTFWMFGLIPVFRIKNRAAQKRWYFFGIPLLERRADIEGFTFRLFRTIPIFSLKKISK